MSDELHTPTALPPSPYPLSRNLDRSHNPVRTRQGRKNLLPLPGIELRFFGRLTRSVVSTRIELCRLLFDLGKSCAKFPDFIISTSHKIFISAVYYDIAASCHVIYNQKLGQKFYKTAQDTVS